MIRPPILSLALLTIVLVPGCDNKDERLARLAEQGAERQAQQNQEMARLNREVAEGTRRLVESDGRSREELIALQRDLQAEQARISDGWDELEAERRGMAEARLRESLLAPALSGVGLLIVSVLPLVLCWYLLHGLARQNEEHAVGDLLIQEVTAGRLEALPPSGRHAALTHEPSPADTAQEEPTGQPEA